MKNTNDYDNTFKSLRYRHKRLFVSVINEVFHKNYPLNVNVNILPSEGFFTKKEDAEEIAELEEREGDCLLQIEDDYYLLECQTYDDNSMAIRIAEYTFLAARSFSDSTQGAVTLNLPYFTVIYLKRTKQTPLTTCITYSFPNGEFYQYSGENLFLDNLTKEEIVEKKLFVFIPFYIIRYERALVSEKNYEKAIADLEFFRESMLQSRQAYELTQEELGDLCESTNVIVSHITDGNAIEKEVTGVMGGHLIEFTSQRVERETRERVQAEDRAKYEPIIAELQHSNSELSKEVALLKEQLAAATH